MEFSLSVLSALPMQTIALVFLALVFLVALLGMGKEQGFLARIASIAPNTLTSIGIFFTFFGIWISLQSFDVTNIEASIPRLLDGLKLAFLSSVAGLGLSVLFRGIEAGKQKDDIAGEVTAGDLYNQLEELNTNTLAVKEALVGDSEASLSTQFGKLRNDFRDFADRMKEDGTQALVKALEEVIKDFNQKISEQFGENFKQLNEAVGALLKWQEEYKNQVEKLTEAFQKTQIGIESIEQSTAKIPEHMQKVETAFDKTEERVEQLYKAVGNLSEMRETAKNAVPELQQSIESMTSGMKESVDSQLEVLKNQMLSMQEAQSNTSNEIRGLTSELGELVKTSLDQTEKSFRQQMDKFEGVLNSLNMGADNVLESTQSVAKQVKEIIANFSTEQEKISREVNSKIEQSLAENVDAMNKSMQDLDQGMQQHLQRALDKMGNNLVSITDEFVKTYKESGREIAELINSISRR